jgi:hypothetical protein
MGDTAECEALWRAVRAAEAAVLDARQQLDRDEQPHPNAPGGDALTAEESLELAGSHQRFAEAERALREAQAAWSEACGGQART